MNPFNMSEAEKKQILQQHKDATSSFYNKKVEIKKGLQKPEVKREEPMKKIEPKKAVVKAPEVKKLELKKTTIQTKPVVKNPGQK